MRRNSFTTAQQLHERLAEIISNTPSGERLLSEPELARRLKVSRAKLREAMRTFETQGQIYRKQGVGTFVVHPMKVIESGLEVLESIDRIAERIGLDVRMNKLEVIQRFPDHEEAEAIAVEPGCEVLAISRVMEAEGRPVAYLVDIVPCGILSPMDLKGGFTGSVLDLIQAQNNVPLVNSRTEIFASAVNTTVARALGIQPGDVVMCFKAYLYAADGHVVDFSYSYFLPGYFRFHVVRRVGQI